MYSIPIGLHVTGARYTVWQLRLPLPSSIETPLPFNLETIPLKSAYPADTRNSALRIRVCSTLGRHMACAEWYVFY